MSFLRSLKQTADDLAERLFIAEHELRAARSIEKRVAASREALAIVDRIDLLRQDIEEVSLTGLAKDSLLNPLEKKAARLLRGEPYRIARWFAENGEHVSWLVGPAAVEPLQMQQPN